jgi:hypothetical protein
LIRSGSSREMSSWRPAKPWGLCDVAHRGSSSGAGWLMETGSEPGKLSSSASSSFSSILRFCAEDWVSAGRRRAWRSVGPLSGLTGVKLYDRDRATPGSPVCRDSGGASDRSRWPDPVSEASDATDPPSVQRRRAGDRPRDPSSNLSTKYTYLYTPDIPELACMPQRYPDPDRGHCWALLACILLFLSEPIEPGG